MKKSILLFAVLFITIQSYSQIYYSSESPEIYNKDNNRKISTVGSGVKVFIGESYFGLTIHNVLGEEIRTENYTYVKKNIERGKETKLLGVIKSDTGKLFYLVIFYSYYDSHIEYIGLGEMNKKEMMIIKELVHEDLFKK